MIIKTCAKHGSLLREQCYIRNRKTTVRKNGTKLNARVEYECKQCVDARLKTEPYAVKRRTNRNYRYATEPSFRKTCLDNEKRKYEDNGPRIRVRSRSWRWRLKVEAIKIYSDEKNCCARCRTTELRFLNLDHIHDDGAEHRRETKVGANPYSWAKKNGWPPIFQVLCFNCNYLKALLSRPVGKLTSDVLYLRRLRLEVLYHYSDGKMSCKECRIGDVRLLTLDHIDGGGNIQRRTLGGRNSDRLFRFLKKSGWPPGYQVLCHNHNSGKEIAEPVEDIPRSVMIP